MPNILNGSLASEEGSESARIWELTYTAFTSLFRFFLLSSTLASMLLAWALRLVSVELNALRPGIWYWAIIVSTFARVLDTLWTVFDARFAAPTIVFSTLLAWSWTCLLRMNNAIRHPLHAEWNKTFQTSLDWRVLTSEPTSNPNFLEKFNAGVKRNRTG